MAKIVTLSLVILFMVFGIYRLTVDNRNLGKEIKKLDIDLDNLNKENRELLADIEYFKIPENLIKELKSQFNYREVGEKLIIVVPSTTPR